MKTKKDIDRKTRGGLWFTIPAGSLVEPISWDANRFWVLPEGLPANSIQRHDAEFYGVSVGKEEVE